MVEHISYIQKWNKHCLVYIIYSTRGFESRPVQSGCYCISFSISFILHICFIFDCFPIHCSSFGFVRDWIHNRNSMIWPSLVRSTFCIYVFKKQRMKVYQTVKLTKKSKHQRMGHSLRVKYFRSYLYIFGVKQVCLQRPLCKATLHKLLWI